MLFASVRKPRRRFRGWLPLGLMCLVFGPFANSVSAESALILPMPREFGDIPALTYGADNQLLGTGTLSINRIDKKHAQIRGEAILKAGGRTRFEAQLAILEDGSGLKLLHQESQSHNQEGRSMGVLHVDHAAGVATCAPPPDSDRETIVVKLPPNDRVANVGLSLLFQPLAAGKTNAVKFQILLCRDDPRLVDFKATIVARSAPKAEKQIVEIRYEPDLGAVIGWLAQAVIPDLSFWFDVTSAPVYLAHQMPIYAQGPEVIIVREGVSPAKLHSLP